MLPSSRTSLAASNYNIREQYHDKKLMKKQKKMKKQDHKQKFEGSLTVVWAIYNNFLEYLTYDLHTRNLEYE